MLIKRNFIKPFVRCNFRQFNILFSTYKEEKIKVGDWNINYVKIGTGPHSLLCMPGGLGSIPDFKPQVEGLNRDKFTIVAWDPPGYGKSRPPDRDFPVDHYERDATYAYEFMKALKITKFSLLGWCSGGRSSLIFAAKYPDVIHKLVVWGTSSYIVPRELEIYDKLKDIDIWPKETRESRVAMYGEEFFRKYWAMREEGLNNLYNAKNGNVCSEMLKDIMCPTFILHGEMDPLINSTQVSHLHSQIKGSRLHLYQEGSHDIHLTHAEDFNKKVEEFLSA